MFGQDLLVKLRPTFLVSQFHDVLVPLHGGSQDFEQCR